MTTPGFIENYQRTPPRRLKILRLTVACAFLFVPLLVSVIYLFANTSFIPDPSLRPWAEQVGVLAAIAVTVVLAAPMWQEYKKTAGTRERVRAIVGTLALPFMTAFAAAHSVGAVALVLHEVGPSEQTRVVEAVWSSSHNRRTACDDSANLKGDSILLNRRVCKLDFEEAIGLRRGDRIELVGRQSRWGLSVQAYTLLSPGESPKEEPDPVPSGTTPTG